MDPSTEPIQMRESSESPSTMSRPSQSDSNEPGQSGSPKNTSAKTSNNPSTTEQIQSTSASTIDETIQDSGNANVAKEDPNTESENPPSSTAEDDATSNGSATNDDEEPEASATPRRQRAPSRCHGHMYNSWCNHCRHVARSCEEIGHDEDLYCFHCLKDLGRGE
ncbi:hypothetical protein PMZ80_004191 [Knufia obscura]|uniref:Uncharacterized protein n=2 Tax=Knufia TaxID=430999 RepID=A0AAN8ED83_9EURO|nr:hypothetical protein PMZ80_004191 [Knufia obscura]KAK5948683.1 hypothetical protein OHC33_010286 [Knufia fluminis]